jgi:hypothetical protein
MDYGGYVPPLLVGNRIRAARCEDDGMSMD